MNPTQNINRRNFLFTLGAASAGSVLISCGDIGKSAQQNPHNDVNQNKYFKLEQRKGHWWFITPKSKAFFSIGLNHIDAASLRYLENIHIWRDKYDGSNINWIKESVAPNLKAWGFNSVGWVQEVTVRQWRHSRSFTSDEYKALDMPYCHMLPFITKFQFHFPYH